MGGSPLILDISKNFIYYNELIVVNLINVFTFKIDGILLKNYEQTLIIP